MTDWFSVFSPVRDELDLWVQNGSQAKLWFRDDDAIEPTDALSQLTAITGKNDVPLLLCVVPERTSDGLSRDLDQHKHVAVAVHGFGHHNHAPPGEKAQELGGHRPVPIVLEELTAARAKLADLYGDRLSGILVPPWNRIAPDVVAHIPELGFSGLSTFGAAHEAADVPGVTQLNTHLDIIDWKGSRGGRDPHWLAREFTKLLRFSRCETRAPIGVLAHHLVHDELAWRFLEELFEMTAQHSAVSWHPADDLLDQAG